MDQIKGIQLLEKLDADGMSEVLTAIAAEDDAGVSAALAKAKADGDLTDAEEKKLKAAARILGPAMAKKYLKAMAPMDDEEEEEEEDAPTLKRRKGESEADFAKRKKVARKQAARDERQGPHGGEEDYEDTPKNLHKDDEGQYDLTAFPREQRPIIRALLRKADADKEELADRLEKAESALQERDEREEREGAIRKAAEFSYLGKADDLAPVFRALRKGGLTKAEVAVVEKAFATANRLVKESRLLGEIGSEATGGEAADSPEVELQTRATELQKGDPKLTREAARARILKSDRGLQDRLNTAQDTRIHLAKGGR